MKRFKYLSPYSSHRGWYLSDVNCMYTLRKNIKTKQGHIIVYKCILYPRWILSYTHLFLKGLYAYILHCVQWHVFRYAKFFWVFVFKDYMVFPESRPPVTYLYGSNFYIFIMWGFQVLQGPTSMFYVTFYLVPFLSTFMLTTCI